MTLIERLRERARLGPDPCLRPPSFWRSLSAGLASIAGSLVLDALLVALGTRLFPSTEGYTHFRFSDYGELTVIGVLGASLAWPVTARVASTPRWLFLRMAVVVTLVLWIPDLWLVVRGQPIRAVVVLAVMHFGIAVVTFNCLVRLAPVRTRTPASGVPRDPTAEEEQPAEPREKVGGFTMTVIRRTAIAMAGLVGLEFALGVGALVVVPYGRTSVGLPSRGVVLYLAHAVLGAILGLGAVGLLQAARRWGRIARLGSTLGVAGVVVAAAGGVATVDHAIRLLGVGLMLVGSFVAAFGYAILITVAPHRLEPSVGSDTAPPIPDTTGGSESVGS
jgi:hypothetical protein